MYKELIETRGRFREDGVHSIPDDLVPAHRKHPVKAR